MINPIYEGETAIIFGTGPSLTPEVIAYAKTAQKEGRAKLFGPNRSFEFDLDVVAGCNWEFWHLYWDEIKEYRCHKWATLDYDKVKQFDINFIEARFMSGLSTDPNYIAHHHGTGPQLINIALHYGIKRMILIGWDMRYPGKVDRYTYTGKRHYFGEDELTNKHWPIFIAKDGTLDGLMKEMVTIKPKDYNIEIINCTPNSAMTCFEMGVLEDCI